jgi:uncharacterized protein YqgC (DUF456 family)
MKNILLILLVLLAVAMIIIGFRAGILPPALTGVGFFTIAWLFYKDKK